MDRESLLDLWRRSVSEDTLLETVSPDASVRPSFVPGADSTERPGKPYRILSELGQGGMGVVLRARQASLRRDVALKKLHPGLLLGNYSDHARANFLAEALINAQLEHPNIVPVHDLVDDGPNSQALVMKQVVGQSWSELLERELDFDLERHLGILLQVCNAVAFAHNRNIVHNDLKPSNVMLGDFGEVLVMDWGLALSLDAEPPEGLRARSAVEGVFGTPSYMPPELANGDGPAIGPWTDVFLLGAILYRVLSGNPPFRSDTFVQSILRAARAEFPPLADSWPEELRAICTRALAAEPEARFRSVAEFQQALQDHLRHRQSLTLSQEARERLEALTTQVPEGGSLAEAERNRIYAGFAETIAAFGQARKLWTGNPGAARGELEARLCFARTALCQRDLGLAEAQLDQIPGEGAQDQRVLRGRLATARRAEARERQVKRRLIGGLALAIALIVVGLSVGLVVLDRQAAEVQRQNDYAAERGEVAEDALNTLVLEVQERLVDELGDQRAHQLAREILSGAREGWERLRDTDVAAEQIGLGTNLARLRLAKLLLDIDGEVDAALREYQAAIDGLAALLQEHRTPDVELLYAEALLGSGGCYTERGELLQARNVIEGCLKVVSTLATPAARELEASARTELAWVLDSQLESEQAAQLLELAVVYRRAQLASDPEDERLQRRCAEAVFALAGTADLLDRYDQAEALCAEALGIRRGLCAVPYPTAADLRRLLRAVLLGQNLATSRGEHGKARALSDEALQWARDLYRREPENRQAGQDLFDALVRAARLEMDHGELRQAESLSQEALELQDQSVERSPTSAAAGAELADVLRTQAYILAFQLQYDAADEVLARAAALLRPRVARDPSQRLMRLRLIDIQVQRSRITAQRGSQAAAVGQLESCLNELAKLQEECPSDRLQASQVYLFHTLSQLLFEQGAAVRAAELAGRALQIQRQRVARAPKETRRRQVLGDCLRRMAAIAGQGADLSQVDGLLRENLALQRQVVEQDSLGVGAREALGLALDDLASHLLLLGHHQEASRLFLECLANDRELASIDASNLLMQRVLAFSFHRQGQMLSHLYRHDEAELAFATAMRLYRELLAQRPQDRALLDGLARCYGGSAQLYAQRGHYLDYNRVLKEQLALVRQLYQLDPASHVYRRLLGDALVHFADSEGILHRWKTAPTLCAEGLRLLEGLQSERSGDADIAEQVVWARLVEAEIEALRHNRALADSLFLSCREDFARIRAAGRPLVKVHVRACFSHAHFLQGTGRPEEALVVFDALLGLLPAYAEELTWRPTKLRALTNKLALMLKQGWLEAAQPVLDEALALLAGPSSPEMLVPRLELPIMHAALLKLLGDHGAAREVLLAGQTALLEVRRQQPRENRLRLLNHRFMIRLARLALEQGRPAEAVPQLEAMVADLRALSAEQPEYLNYAVDLHAALTELGDAYEVLGSLDPAWTIREEEVQLARSLVERDSLNIDARDALARSLLKLGHIAIGADQLDLAVTSLLESRAQLDVVFAAGYDNASLRFLAAAIATNRGTIAHHRADFGAARQLYEQGLVWLERTIALDPSRQEQLEVRRAAFARFCVQERRWLLLTGEVEPVDEEERLQLARDQFSSLRLIEAVQTFERAFSLDAPAVPQDFLTAARAAAIVAAGHEGEHAADLQAQALRWLEVWLTELVGAIGRADADTRPGLQEVWRTVRDTDADLASLRALPSFEALFEGVAREAGWDAQP